MKTALWKAALLCASAVLVTSCAPPYRTAAAMKAAQYSATHPHRNLQVYVFPATSMQPTLTVGTEILVDMGSYEHATPQRGDIITFIPPLRSLAPFVKRVIGLPGDRLAVRRDGVYVNGVKLNETYVREPAHYEVAVMRYGIYVGDPQLERLGGPLVFIPAKRLWTAADRLPKDCYFVLGDNRNNSEDSHIYGCIERNRITGKVVQIL